jgi:ribonuclease HII
VAVPTLEREAALWAKGIRIVAGLDEVGRGPLAGPVVAGVVAFRAGQDLVEHLRDSKEMTASRREETARAIRATALAYAVAAASPREIDRLNIKRATALAMRRALRRLPVTPDYILLDGRPLPDLGVAHEAVVDGDAQCQSIAAAAVLAKCVRDELMARLGRRYPAFQWERNKGYATAEHLAALHQEGPTPHHRQSFAPVAQPRLL